MMIENSHWKGDNFKYEGVLGFDPDPTFDVAQLQIVAALSKSHGGIKIGDLAVSLGAVTTNAAISVIPFTVTATPAETLAWPQGPVTMQVVVKYGAGYQQTSRPVHLNITGKDLT